MTALFFGPTPGLPPAYARKGRLLLPIPGDWIIQGGAAALLALVVLMILTGRLVPRPFYRQLERERDQWRTAALKAMGHTDALLPGAQIAAEVTKSFSDATAAAIEGRNI